MVYESPCSMSAMRRKTGNRRGNSLQLMFNKKEKLSAVRALLKQLPCWNQCKIHCFYTAVKTYSTLAFFLQKIKKIILKYVFCWKHSNLCIFFPQFLHFVCPIVREDFGQLVGSKQFNLQYGAHSWTKGLQWKRRLLKSWSWREESCAWKERMRDCWGGMLRDSSLQHRHVRRFNQKDVWHKLRLWRVWQISAARWKTWPERGGCCYINYDLSSLRLDES